MFNRLGHRRHTNKMFKSGLVFAVLAVVVKNITAISDEQKDQIQSKFIDFGTECIKDHPLSEDDITSFKDKKFPDGENAKCFTACVFKKVGIIDDKGNLSHTDALENAKKIFEAEDELKNIEEFLTTCAKVNNEDVSDGEKGCERAVLAYSCLIENSEKFGFNIDF